MLNFYTFFAVTLVLPAVVQCDITNLNEFLSTVNKNTSYKYPVGFLSRTNYEVVKRYLPANIHAIFFDNKSQLLEAIDNESVIAGMATGRLAQDLEQRYHVFTSSIVSPQAMLLAPDFSELATPYGLRNQTSSDLFDALNAAIADVQRQSIAETLLTQNNRTDLIRVYTCQQDSQLPVPNRNETSGFLQEILFKKKPLLIGGLGPFDWGRHDGNYNLNPPTGFYPQLLEAVVNNLGGLKGSDGYPYGQGITFNRTYFPSEALLFRALLDGNIHATDVYLLVDGSYNGTRESCKNDSACRPHELCTDGICTHRTRPRYLHFRTTCTTASRDTRYITRKTKETIKTQPDTPPQTPKTRWIGFVLVFVALFAAIFLTLLILVRRKKPYRIEHTLQGGFGKFARLQEDAEPPMDGIDAFEDHDVQSPRDNVNSTS